MIRRVWRFVSFWLLCVILPVAITLPFVVDALTAPGQQPQRLARLQWNNGEYIVVALPADANRAGEIVLWWAGYDQGMLQEILSVPSQANRN